MTIDPEVMVAFMQKYRDAETEALRITMQSSLRSLLTKHNDLQNEYHIFVDNLLYAYRVDKR